MRKILLLASAVCLVATNVSAFDPYISAKAKYAFTRSTIKAKGLYEGKSKYEDNVWGGSAALGVANGNFRMELEYTQNATAKSGDAKIKMQAALFNLYYDFDLGGNCPLIPYIGAGLGVGHVKYDTKKWNTNDTGFAAQASVGVNYKISENVALDLGYRYMAYDDTDDKYTAANHKLEKIEYRPHSQEVLFGVRYSF